ncbi:hypothetical protein ACN38_g8922 [Penicillium nordicum]|uniref:Uncharacterized protein n=1 Tax=Penicillium nordicum TaxID=229535 RepID=A0A0M9WD15_9EURO|nr:hypothetical protein ACN38_g8922 [Penicillium nordicum]
MRNGQTKERVLDFSLSTSPNRERERRETICYNSLPYKDSPTPKLAACQFSSNFLQIHFRFTSDSLQIQLRFTSDPIWGLN